MGSRIRHFMKYKKFAAAIVALLILILAVSLLAGRPAAEVDVADAGISGQENPEYDIYTVELPSGHTVGCSDQTTVIIDGEAYDMTQLCDAVNGIMPEVREFDKYIVVDGHISPSCGYYGFFNTESREWEWGLAGALLTWDENWETLENPLESVVYMDQNVVRDWKANEIAVLKPEEEYIYDLRRVGNNITVTLVSYEGKQRESDITIGR